MNIQINEKPVTSLDLTSLRPADVVSVTGDDGNTKSFVIVNNREEEDLAETTVKARRRRKSLRFRGLTWKYTLIRGYDAAARIFGCDK